MQTDAADARDPYDPAHVATRAEFGELLTAIRVHAGLTVRELARRLKVPAGTLGDYFSGRHLPSFSQLPLFQALLRECGIPDALGDRWVDMLQRIRTASDGRATRRPLPYRGLEPFGADDSALFFGREVVTTEVLERLTALAHGPSRDNPVMAVIGASGSGKSSLLRAGVLAAINAGALDTSTDRWRGSLMMPGSDPTATFEACTHSLRDAKAVVVIDQFEEIFTVCTSETRRSFLAALASRRSDDCLVVFSLRADFFGHAAREEELLHALAREQVLVSPMQRAQLRAAIVEPARRAGMAVEEGLVELLLADLAPPGAGTFAHDAGALPFLSHALLETWQHAHRNVLRVADYIAVGGLDGAISQTAEELYTSLNPEEQSAVRHIFTRMLNVDDDAIVTRRRISRAEVDALLGEGQSKPSTPNLFEQFVARRLLTVDAGTVEISHEALLTAWPRLQEWIDEDRTELRRRRRIVDAAKNWHDGGRDNGLLLTGTRLDAAIEYTSDASRIHQLTALERHFVETSAAHAAAERRAEQRRTRRLRRLLAALIVLTVVATGSAAFALDLRAGAARTRDEALSRQVAIEATQLRDSAPSLSAQLALAAYRLAPTTEARSALLDVSSTRLPTRLLGASGSTAIALSRDGTLLAVTHADDGSIHLYRRNESKLTALTTIPGDKPAAQLFAVAISPDNTMLATGGTNDHVALWDISSTSHPRRIALLGGFSSAVQSITFSSDGQTLLAVGDPSGLHRWSVQGHATSEPMFRDPPGDGAIQSVGTSRDGRWIVTGNTNGRVRVWDAKTGRNVATAEAGASSLTAAAFSPDASVLAAASKDGSVYLWAVDSTGHLRQARDPLGGFTSWVNSLAFSSDGHFLAAGSSDNTAQVWSTASWVPFATFDHPVPVTGTVFTPNDEELISSGADGAVRLWQLSSPNLGGISGNVFELAYASDGSALAAVTSGPQGRATLWNTKSPDQPWNVIPSSEFGPSAGSGTLTPDGRLLALANRGGQIQLFDVHDPPHSVPVGRPLMGATPLVEFVTFNRSGTLLAAGDDSGAVRLWDITHPDAPRALPTITGPKSIVLSVAFSPNSNLLAAASADNDVWLWDVSDPTHPKHLATLTGFANYAYSVAFTPDGRTLVAGSADHTVRLWEVNDPAHPQALGKPLAGPTDYVYSVAVSPDGHTLAAATTAHRVFLWDIRHRNKPKLFATLGTGKGQFFAVTFSPTGPAVVAAGTDPTVNRWFYETMTVAQMICSDAGDPITRAEWAQYVPGAHYDPPCQ